MGRTLALNERKQTPKASIKLQYNREKEILEKSMELERAIMPSEE